MAKELFSKRKAKFVESIKNSQQYLAVTDQQESSSSSSSSSNSSDTNSEIILPIVDKNYGIQLDEDDEQTLMQNGKHLEDEDYTTNNHHQNGKQMSKEFGQTMSEPAIQQI